VKTIETTGDEKGSVFSITCEDYNKQSLMRAGLTRA